ncbi:hypothetical protein CKO31_03915 [Thiohalocapsa halophila]|uniref:Uncharacterized protein n=1 Tax=Thiohalocapsa halophila TaxID=69359 RepID=A0ABS1CDC4_9GAMM|nr:hypothetical protein [Thiohalocapsa halophila]
MRQVKADLRRAPPRSYLPLPAERFADGLQLVAARDPEAGVIEDLLERIEPKREREPLTTGLFCTPLA